MATVYGSLTAEYMILLVLHTCTPSLHTSMHVQAETCAHDMMLLQTTANAANNMHFLVKLHNTTCYCCCCYCA
jgi:hypothetical protein